MQRLNAPTFFDQAIPLSGNSALVRNVLLAIFGSLLLAVCARASIQIGPVPLTLQTLALMIIGATYGWRLAGLTVLLYLAYGAMNFPVFAQAPYAGLGYILGGVPSAGFLWGFVLGATFLGAAAQWGMARNPIMLAGAMLIAHVILYIPGVLWGATYIGATWLPEGELFNVFVTPFLLGDAIKILIAIAIVPIAYKAVETFRNG